MCIRMTSMRTQTANFALSLWVVYGIKFIFGGMSLLSPNIPKLVMNFWWFQVLLCFDSGFVNINNLSFSLALYFSWLADWLAFHDDADDE